LWGSVWPSTTFFIWCTKFGQYFNAKCFHYWTFAMVLCRLSKMGRCVIACSSIWRALIGFVDDCIFS
jgi:hypothetical protein